MERRPVCGPSSPYIPISIIIRGAPIRRFVFDLDQLSKIITSIVKTAPMCLWREGSDSACLIVIDRLIDKFI